MIDASELPLLATFQAVVRCGSFTRAAAELRLSKSVVSDRMRTLEARLGHALLTRSTRRIHITRVGERVLEVASGMSALEERLRDIVQAERDEPAGALRVACTTDLGPLLVAPAVARVAAAHPRVSFELVADDAQRDLLAEGVDVAVRLGAPRASSSEHTVRRLARFAEPIVATPLLAAQLGRPASPAALAGAPWVRHALLSRRTMRFTGPSGATEELAPRTRAEANTGLTLLALITSGIGVGCLPEYMVRHELASGALVELCPGWVWKEVALHVLLPPRASVRPLHRSFVDALRAQLAIDEARWRVRPQSA